MSDRKPAMQIYKVEDGQWRWRVYSATGEVITVSNQDYARRIDAEQDAANTMTAIIEGVLQAIGVERTGGQLMRLKPVVEALMLSAGTALVAIEELGYYNPNGLTRKGRKLIEENTRSRLEKENAELELSKAMPPIKASTQIPVQYADQPQVIAVRIK